MRNRARLADHPLHPMLIPIPIASFLLSFVFDVVYLVSGNPFWYAMAFWLIVAGIVGGVIAAVPGLLDYLTSMPSEAARQVGLRHGLTNGGIVVLYLINAIIRGTGPMVGGTLGVAVFLSLVGVVALGYAGWLGGDLVYRHRVGIDEAPAPPVAVITAEAEEEKRAA